VPTYDYRCKSCDHELEVVQSFTDDALTTCELCGGDLRKVFGSVGISFKGSGFYKNDSRGSGKKSSDNGSSDAKPAETKSPEATPATKSDTKSDSKPAATTTSSS
jgi:putative FmdB family regulatory protein